MATVFLSKSLSPSFFMSNGLAETMSMAPTASLAPSLPSEVVYAADTPSQSASQSSKSVDSLPDRAHADKSSRPSLPIIPIAVASGGGLVVITGMVALYLFFRRRRRRAALLCGRTTNPPDLDAEMPLGEISGSRTLSQLTYSTPYAVPRSTITVSTAAPSTVSIGQQYLTFRIP
ncbi:hypothetical protein C8R45DRAFT_61161 [Mycena sanguinolenta]|nr:hypothetical protein C8R45DRAFT_61161 [Mycena sanguinolenta]